MVPNYENDNIKIMLISLWQLANMFKSSETITREAVAL